MRAVAGDFDVLRDIFTAVANAKRVKGLPIASPAWTTIVCRQALREQALSDSIDYAELGSRLICRNGKSVGVSRLNS